MAKFKVGQVVAIKSSKNPDYRFISGIGECQSSIVYFVDGELASKDPEGKYRNAFWFGFMLRKLTAREAGR
jgi:hypothetical protein